MALREMTPLHRSALAHKALDHRIHAAHELLRHGMDSTDAQSILGAVLMPMNAFGEYDPLLGLDLPMSSDTKPSSAGRASARSEAEPSPRKESEMTTAHHRGTKPSLREMQILNLISEGMTNKEIADRLNLSQETIKSHIKHILDKLGARTRGHAIAIAFRTDILA